MQICDTRILGDVTFIARNPHTYAYILNSDFPKFALAILTTAEQIFSIFHRTPVGKGTPEVDRA